MAQNVSPSEHRSTVIGDPRPRSLAMRTADSWVTERLQILQTSLMFLLINRSPQLVGFCRSLGRWGFVVP
jgi:hypothetical protein